MKWQRRFNIALTIALTTAFILLGIFSFRQSYCRTFECLIDLYGGFKYYFCVLFDLPTEGLPVFETHLHSNVPSLLRNPRPEILSSELPLTFLIE